MIREYNNDDDDNNNNNNNNNDDKKKKKKKKKKYNNNNNDNNDDDDNNSNIIIILSAVAVRGGRSWVQTPLGTRNFYEFIYVCFNYFFKNILNNVKHVFTGRSV